MFFSTSIHLLYSTVLYRLFSVCVAYILPVICSRTLFHLQSFSALLHPIYNVFYNSETFSIVPTSPSLHCTFCPHVLYCTLLSFYVDACLAYQPVCIGMPACTLHIISHGLLPNLPSIPWTSIWIPCVSMTSDFLPSKNFFYIYILIPSFLYVGFSTPIFTWTNYPPSSTSINKVGSLGSHSVQPCSIRNKHIHVSSKLNSTVLSFSESRHSTTECFIQYS